MSEHAVSVVIPAYQGERFLGAAIDSVLAQDHTPVEIVVVDDGSTDGTPDVARAHPVRYVHQTNAGVAAARNAGIAAAQHDLLAFLDQDDLWLPEKLSRQVAVLAARPEVAFVNCRMRWFREADTPPPPWVRHEWIERPQLAYVTSAMLARRSAFETAGGFDESYRFGQRLRLADERPRCGLTEVVLDDVLVHHRVHGANASYDVRAARRDMLRLLRESAARKRAG